MIAAIMQPYFVPYIGYFQLMAACDVFVILDDVQFIQRGWVNRNRILQNGRAAWITLPVARDSHHLAISARRYLLEHPLVYRTRRRIRAAYARAPHVTDTMTLLDEGLSHRDSNVATFNTALLKRVAAHLGICTPVLLASELGRPEDAKGPDVVLSLCQRLGASVYANPIGGLDLYDAAEFAARGVELRFLEPRPPQYAQFGQPYVPSLSIIDVLMFNDRSTVTDMLAAHRFVASRRQPARSGLPAPGSTV